MIQFYKIHKIGKEMGLNKKDINNILFYKNDRPIVNSILFWIIFLIIIIVALFTLSIIPLNSIMSQDNSTYPSGTLYSTVKTSDFKNKK